MTTIQYARNESATYYDYTDLTVYEWREKLATSEVNNYTFVNDTTAVHVVNGVAYVKQYDPVSRSVGTIEVREV